MSATSAGIGQGSTFKIHLPATAIVRQTNRSGSAASSESMRASPGYRVLVADDNRDAADSLAMLLQIAGYEVHLAHSGDEAIRLAQRERPSALILDIGMPDTSGYEVAQSLRQQEWARQALFIAVTGWGQIEDKHRAHEAGFDHHLTKPVDAQELETLLKRFRERSEQLDQRQVDG